MTETKHTPWPWKLILGDIERRQASRIVDSQDEDYVIASCIREWRNSEARKTDDANARLIATAPELLESLRNAAATLETLMIHYANDMTAGDYAHRGRVLQIALETIAKATKQ